MARMKPRAENSVVLFDVFYEDGGRASNRKVPSSEVGGLDGEGPVLTYITDQDRKIAEKSGLAPRPIKRIVRSGG
jgi:hypothetical protein